MLKPHSPSSPTRPPVEHLYFTITDSEDNTLHFFTHAFGAAYAAHHWLTAIMDDTPAAQRWISTACVELTHQDHTLQIRGSHLENMIEYEPNKKEQAWTPPYPDSKALKHAKEFWKPKFITSPTTEPEPTPAGKKEPTIAPRHRKQKPAPDDSTTTVAILAAEAGIQPNKARQILRKNNIQKPSQGWTFKKDDPIITTIRTLFGKG